MRSPDEIKKGLEEEIPVHYHIDGEPRLTPRLLMDMQWLHKDAFALIQQLEEEREAAIAHSGRLTEHIWELEKDIDRLTDETCNAYNIQNEQLVRIQQLETERDAAVETLKEETGCRYCAKYIFTEDYISTDCLDCISNCNWQWRGVQKEE